jgi:hypothetical protein
VRECVCARVLLLLLLSLLFLMLSLKRISKFDCIIRFPLSDGAKQVPLWLRVSAAFART